MSAIAGLALRTVRMNIPLALGGPVQLPPWRIPASVPGAVVPHAMGRRASACILGQGSWERIRRLWTIIIGFLILRSMKSHLLRRRRHRILFLEGLQSSP
jgi:hypothetical protein